MARHSTHARDAGLRKVRTTTKWIAGGAAGLVAVFTAFTLPHAKSSSATTGNGTSTGATQGNGSGGSGDGSGLGNSQNADPGFQTPDQPPSQSFQPPVARSGGS
jgi:hypothetical protein